MTDSVTGSSYAAAGVDVEAGEIAVTLMKESATTVIGTLSTVAPCETVTWAPALPTVPVVTLAMW